MNLSGYKKIGAAMGSKPVPACANILMANLDQIIKALAKLYDEGDKKALQLTKQFFRCHFYNIYWDYKKKFMNFKIK